MRAGRAVTRPFRFSPVCIAPDNLIKRPADAVAQLAREAGRGELAEVILRRTGGNALFVTETLRGLAAGETGVPESLPPAVLARLRRAGPGTEELLRAGAVLGATVDPAVVAGLLEVPEHVAAHRCEQAAASRLLTGTVRLVKVS